MKCHEGQRRCLTFILVDFSVKVCSQGPMSANEDMKQEGKGAEVKLDLINDPGMDVHIASNILFGGFLRHDGLLTASKVSPRLRIKLQDLNYQCWQAYLASKCLHELNHTD